MIILFSILTFDDKKQNPILEVSEEDISDFAIFSAKKSNPTKNPFVIDNSFATCHQNEFITKRSICAFEEPNFKKSTFRESYDASCNIPFVSMLSVWDSIKLGNLHLLIKGIKLHGLTGTEPTDIKTSLELLIL